MYIIAPMDSDEHSDAMIVYCTAPAEKAAELAKVVVQERLAACVNLIPHVRSIYRWQGEICDDEETLAIIKTARGRFEALRKRLVELHPYDCPEVIAFPVEQGHQPYLDWVREMTTR